MDLHKKTFTTEVGGKPLTLETSILASQANASVLGTYGDTVVLATVVMGKTDKVDMPYFPLRVDYEEKFYAAGKLLGSRYTRREARPSENAMLTSRLIDRAVRPLFNHQLRRDIQVVTTVLSIDGENDPDFIALLSASAALSISDIPWNGPLAGVRVSHIDGKNIINPDKSTRENFDLELFISGTGDRINMLESEGREAPESLVASAAQVGFDEIRKLVDFQNTIVKEVGKEKTIVTLSEPSSELVSAVQEYLKDKLEEAVFTPDKAEMENKLRELKQSLTDHIAEKEFDESELRFIADILDSEIDELVHEEAINNGRRPDGRKNDELRKLDAGVKILKRAHGSALFIRGNTQALSIATLGGPGDELLVENIEGEFKKNFFHHYNFPPYSVGESGPFRGPGRREIGHGALAEKALRAVVPKKEDFPYTIRVVSETLSSNGSSSMASTCATSLALMDAGVPISSPVTGIAMGLMSKGDKYVILTDIQGPEDHHGDMDLKVAGTKNGITAMQMDVKIDGITVDMLKETLEQAKVARLKILEVTDAALNAPREDLSEYAPRIYTVLIHPDKIRDVIGPGGKMINEIIEKTGTSIDIEQDGSVYITGDDAEKAQEAVDWVKNLTKDFQIGETVEGTIVKVMDFGAILQFGPQKDGMIHISEIAKKHVDSVEEFFKVGDSAKAKIVKIDTANGRIGLSTKEFN